MGAAQELLGQGPTYIRLGLEESLIKVGWGLPQQPSGYARLPFYQDPERFTKQRRIGDTSEDRGILTPNLIAEILDNPSE